MPTRDNHTIQLGLDVVSGKITSVGVSGSNIIDTFDFDNGIKFIFYVTAIGGGNPEVAVTYWSNDVPSEVGLTLLTKEQIIGPDIILTQTAGDGDILPSNGLVSTKRYIGVLFDAKDVSVGNFITIVGLAVGDGVDLIDQNPSHI